MAGDRGGEGGGEAPGGAPLNGLPSVFLGTPEAAVPALRALVAAGLAPDLAVTPPHRPRGRGGRVEPCPVAAAAEAAGIPVHATEDVNSPLSLGAIHARRPALLLVVAFGQILGDDLLRVPGLGALNLHFSLLPRWRGAAPVQRAIEAGDAVTGVTVQRVVRKLDAGPVIALRETEVGTGERAGELEARLADLGAALLAGIVAHAAETGALIPGKEQDERLVKVARKVRKEEGRAEFAQSPAAFCWKARALHPWPLVTAELRAGARKPERIALHRVEPAALDGVAEEPGTVLAAGKEGILVACGGGSVRLTSLQRPGGKVLEAAAFLNGFPVRPGDRFA